MKISVIIATYNGMKFIDDTIISIMGNQGIDVELIIVDDCSTDGTWEYLQEKWSDKTILIRNDKNYGGPSHGYNVGIERASNNWCSVFDQDDTVDPWRFYKQVSMLETYGLSICATSRNNVSAGKKTFINCDSTNQVFFSNNETFRSLLSLDPNGQKIFLNTLVFKKDIAPRFEETTGCLDFDFILELFHGHDSCHINEPLIDRLLHGGNLSLTDKYRRQSETLLYLCQEKYMKQFPHDCKIGRKHLNIRIAKRKFSEGKPCYNELFHSTINYKSVGMILTAWSPWLRKIVLKHFNIYIR